MKPFLLLSTRPEDDASAGELASILRLGGLGAPELIRIRVEEAPLGPLDLDRFAGIFLGGGPFNSSDPVKSELQLRVEADLGTVLDEVIERDLPFLGLCYGIGTLSSRLGAPVDRTFGEEVGIADVTLTGEGRADPLFTGVPDRFKAFVGHKEASVALAPEAVLLASGVQCPIQAFRVGRNVYATQFHPELDPDGMADRIRIYSSAGYFPEETTEELAHAVSSSTITAEVHLLIANFVAIARGLDQSR